MNSTQLTQRWSRLPSETLRRLQAEKLRRYLRDVVVPFSAHYRELFQQHGLKADDIRTLEDLERIPFSSKMDLTNTPVLLEQLAVVRGERHHDVAQVTAQLLGLEPANGFPR